MVKDRSGEDLGKLRRVTRRKAAEHRGSVLLFRVARSVDPHYYLSDLGLELEHLGIAQRAPCGSAASAYFDRAHIGEVELARFLVGQPTSALRPLATRRREVQALELLFVAPKPVSIAALLGPDAQAAKVVEAHHEALEGALRYLERHSAATSHAEHNAVAALSGVRFTHGVSRSLDPHLHSHVLIANLAQGESGRFGTLDQRGFRAHLDAAGALYDARIEARCRELGFATQLPPVSRAIFSTRQAELRQRQVERQLRFSRRFPESDAKVSFRREDLVAKWDRQLHDMGLDRTAFSHVEVLKPRPQRRLDEDRFRAILLGDDRRITRRKVVEAWAWASGGIAAERVDDAVDLVVRRPTSIFEEELREVEVITSERVRRVLGDRPLDLRELERWNQASRLLERSVDSSHRDRDAVRLRSSRRESHGWSR